MHIISCKALSLKEAESEEFKAYQNRVINNAKPWQKALMGEGLKLFSAAPTTILMLVDLQRHRRTGKLLEVMLDEVNITTNKNSIPNDTPACKPQRFAPRHPSVTTQGHERRGYGGYRQEYFGE